METTLLHPPLVHFAIVLPVVALIFQLAYSVTNNYSYSQWSARILSVAALVMLGAWYTGGLEGQDVYPLLSEDGQEALKSHKSLGLYIMIATVVLAIVKFVACKSRNVILETIVFIGLLTVTSSLAYQGLLGGDVAYKHGGGVQNYSDGMDCLADPSDFIEEEEEEE
jgi:uncharacterized membrane protein